MRLNDLSVKALAVPERGQKTYWDSVVPGFGCRVSQGGTRSFVVMHGRSRQLTTIGRVGIISLAQARQRAKEILAEQVLGKTRAPTHISVEAAVEQFLSAHDVRPGTMAEYKRILERHFLPKLRLEPIERVKTHDLTRIIDKMASTPSEARHTYATASVFFNWALGRRMIEQSPLAGVKAPKNSDSRERVLSDDELAIVLRTAAVTRLSIGKIVQLLIFTGQRRGEITALRWTWIDEAARMITIPGEFVKNGRTHIVPFGQMTAAVLASVPKTGELLFPARGHTDRAFNGWSKSGLAFNRSCGIDHFQLHDLRRSVASGLQRCGVRLETIEDRVPRRGVRAAVVSRSPAGLAGIVRLPRRGAV